MTTELLPDKRQIAAAFVDVRELERQAGVAKLTTVALACDVWSIIDGSAFDSRGDADPRVLFGERLITPGGEGTPQVAEFLALELGPGLGISVDAARQLVADVLNLRHRLPILWEMAVTGRVREWAARRVARETEALPLARARELDARLSPRIEGWTEAKLLREAERLALLLDDDAEERRRRAQASRYVTTASAGEPGVAWLSGKIDAAAAVHLEATLDEGARILAAGGVDGDHATRRADTLQLLAHPGRAHLILDQGLPFDQAPSGDLVPQNVDPGTGEVRGTTPAGACRHGAELIVRVTDRDLARGGGGELHGFGPLTQQHLAQVLGGCAKVTVRPVIDLTAPCAVAVYKPSPELQWIVAERDQTELYPYSRRPARSRLIDRDHTIPHAGGGPTENGNLGSLSRLVHRAITHAGFRVDQPQPGTLHLTTPAGQEFWVNAHGTFTTPPLGRARLNDPANTTTAVLTTALGILARHRDHLVRAATSAATDTRAASRAVLGRPLRPPGPPPRLIEPPAIGPLECAGPCPRTPHTRDQCRPPF